MLLTFFVESAIKWPQWFRKEESLKILNLHSFLFLPKTHEYMLPEPITEFSDNH